MPGYDADQVCNENPIVDVISSYIELKKDGPEFKACCPFHSEATPSFTVSPSKGFYHCFGCGAHGDQIDFVMEYEQVKFTDACKILGGEKKQSNDTKAKRKSKKVDVIDPYEGIEVIMPVPEEAGEISPNKTTPKLFNPKRADDPSKRFTNYKPSMVFPYRNAAGLLIGYVLRIDFDDGKKITPTITWCKLPDGTESWCHCSFPDGRSLYGAEDLTPDKPMLVCEGEKARGAAKRLLGMHYICLAWNGGTAGRHKTDWTIFKDRRVFIWSDNDQPGINSVIGHDSSSGFKKGAAQYIIEAGATSVKHSTLDTDKPKGWDAADAEAEGMSTDDVISWAKLHSKPFEINDPEPEQDETEPEQPDNEIPDHDQEEPPQEHNHETSGPFRILGYNRGVFYYLPDRSQQLVALTAPQHTVNNLLSIATNGYWEVECPNSKGFDINMAVNMLISKSYTRGLFDPHELLRGRGAWLDDGRAVLHLGSRCYVDGVETSPQQVSSRYIYEQQTDLAVRLNNPLNNNDAHQLVEICEALSWEDKLSAALLIGWCVIAPVCGILNWRPHIWITGPSGSGKTTVIKDIIGRIVGSMALHMEGKTTEAGIRQQLCQDARPIVFDEAEAEDDASARRMQSILDLARVASSGGKIIKGSQSGSGVSYSVRSCFCFSSINTSVQHFADESRINKLILRKDASRDAKTKYDELDKKIKSTFTPEYSASMLARSVKYLPVLQKNCDRFIDAATRVFGSRRLADQMGTLLAGYYLCHSVKEITSEQAEEWLSERDWTEHTDSVNRQDEQRLLEFITTRRIRVEDNKGTHDISIGEMILCADNSMDIVDQASADRELKRRGILVDFQHVLIANNSQPMKELLSGTAWSSDWARPLKDLYQAEVTNVKYFSPGIKSRAVKLPIDIFKGE